MLRLCQIMLNVVVKVVATFGVIYRVPSTTPAHNDFCYSAVAHILTHWCRRRGCRECKHTPKSFDLVKTLAKSFKRRAKSLKTFINSVKVWAKLAPNIFWFEKNLRPVFGEVCENSGKNHSHPQKFTCSYTYVLTPSVNLAFRPKSGFKNKCRSRAGFGLIISGSCRVQASK